jgi:hypothetical protein
LGTLAVIVMGSTADKGGRCRQRGDRQGQAGNRVCYRFRPPAKPTEPRKRLRAIQKPPGDARHAIKKSVNKLAGALNKHL